MKARKTKAAKGKRRPKVISGYWGMRSHETMNKLFDQHFGVKHGGSTESVQGTCSTKSAQRP